MDDSVTLRDADLEARAANTAYAQARAVLEATPEITATDLVERLRRRAAELAERTRAQPRDRMSRAVAPPSTPRDETADPNR